MIVVERLVGLPLAEMVALVEESEQESSRFLRRLVEEWSAGVNRFDCPGEVLFAARVAGRLVGVCGLNIDPYAASRRVGRVRRLYVSSTYRRQGVGRRLVQEVIEASRGVFDCLRLRTDSAEAARFYEALGFQAGVGVGDCTHVLGLGGCG